MMQEVRKRGILSTGRNGAFTLIEIVAAITVVALIVSTSLVIINHCLAAAADLKMRTAAFALARENMEKLLGANALAESVEYGDSNEVAGMTWETRVEPFYEPHTAQMWLRAVCSAWWYDLNGRLQTIEFTHWLGALSAQDVARIIRRRQEQQEALDEQALAEIQGLYRSILAAKEAAVIEGYGRMVDLCRRLIRDYPLTTTANEARALLDAMPSSEKRQFGVTPAETTPVAAAQDTTTAAEATETDLTLPVQIPPESPNEKIGDFTAEQLQLIFETDAARFMRIIARSL